MHELLTTQGKLPFVTGLAPLDRRATSGVSSWSNPPAWMLAARVSTLDSRLGHAVARVDDLLRVQSSIVSRQNCALRAIRAYAESGRLSPAYLVDPTYALDAPSPCERPSGQCA